LAALFSVFAPASETPIANKQTDSKALRVTISISFYPTSSNDIVIDARNTSLLPTLPPPREYDTDKPAGLPGRTTDRKR
jgi:hypothetical protein